VLSGRKYEALSFWRLAIFLHFLASRDISISSQAKLAAAEAANVTAAKAARIAYGRRRDGGWWRRAAGR